MKVLGLGMAIIGVLLMVEAWQSHKTGTAPAPITHVTTVLSGLGTAPTTPNTAPGPLPGTL